MKLIVVLLVSLAVFLTGQSVRSTVSGSSSPRGDTQISNPVLERIHLKGNKLIVIGRDFAEGATILINDEKVTTQNDAELPTTRLVARKGGKKISLKAISNIYVENPDTGFSWSLEYFRRRSLFSLILPFAGTQNSVYLHVGDYVFVRRLDRATRWFGAGIITRVFDVRLPSDDSWSFQAVQPGTSRFYAEQDTGGGSPILVFYDIGIIVE